MKMINEIYNADDIFTSYSDTTSIDLFVQNEIQALEV